MLTELELLRLVEAGENQHVEFKRLVHSPEKIAKSISAFANSAGGTILIGVDDDKRIVGIESEKETAEIVWEAATQFVQPAAPIETEVAEFRGRDVLAVLVQESDRKPHYHLSQTRDPKTFKKITERKAYVRQGDKNIVAAPEAVALMKAEHRPVRISFGENERMLMNYLNAYHRITLREFSRLVNISDRRASRILVSLVRAGVIHLHTEGKQCFYTLKHLAVSA
ncbi:MAG: ATP-binding protein [Chloroherpetonaceae bacterium]|nr:ATP-binding protein [Chloroherpetonaceae bacterium]MDW8437063.1 ATP-binding protein [Chloroherpetonaceae bacterium]